MFNDLGLVFRLRSCSVNYRLEAVFRKGRNNMKTVTVAHVFLVFFVYEPSAFSISSDVISFVVLSRSA